MSMPPFYANSLLLRALRHCHCSVAIIILMLLIAGKSFSASGSFPKRDSLQIGPTKKSALSKLIDFTTKKRSFLIAPQLDRAPETGFLTGLYYLQLFKNKKDTTLRTSNTSTFLSITEHKQYILEFNEVLFMHQEKFILRGASIFTRYNEFFYGLGSDVNLKKRENIEFNLFQTTQRFFRVITKKFFMGLQYQYNNTYNLGYPPDGILAKSDAVGKEGSSTSGGGPILLYDSRDNVIYARTGIYCDASMLFARTYFGGTCSFTNFTLDARKYLKIYKNTSICFQTIAKFNWGQVPFRQLALLGGDAMMRGYYMGCYRNNDMLALQTELRIPVWKFFGVVLFGAAGEAEAKLHQFNDRDIKFCGGGGLRFMLIKHERVNVGGDIGFGKNSKTVYFNSGESF